jgi:glycosyltransferase involved in cell wall biosynthesis
MTHIPFVCTAHSRYSLNYGLLPYRQTCGVVCVSETVQDYLSSWLPPNAPVRVIHNALPRQSKPWRGGNEKKRLLYLGRLTEKKGPMFLIESLAEVSQKNWVLDVVGDGPLRGELEARAETLGLREHISFHGYRNDAASWIASCDLFLFPSKDEGMGLSLVEALASGAPALSSDLPAVREIAYGDGMLPSDDKAAWRDAIERVISGATRPTLALKISLPDETEMARRTTALYREVLAGSKR